METTLDKRYIKSKISIENAIETLYSQGKNFSNITISEITKLANISRKTFYLHYVDLNDFILTTINTGIDKINKILFESKTNSFVDTLTNYFSVITDKLQESTMTKMLVQDETYDAYMFDKLKEAIKEFLAFNEHAPELDKFEKEFCASGALYTYKYWARQHKDDNFEYCKTHIREFSERVAEILQNKAL